MHVSASSGVLVPLFSAISALKSRMSRGPLMRRLVFSIALLAIGLFGSRAVGQTCSCCDHVSRMCEDDVPRGFCGGDRAGQVRMQDFLPDSLRDGGHKYVFIHRRLVLVWKCRIDLERSQG